MNTLKRALSFGRPHIREIILLSVSSLFNAGIGILYLFILKNIVNTFYDKDLSRVKTTIILTALLYITQSVVSFFSSYLNLYTSEKISCDIKKTLFSHIVSLPIDFFKTESEGALMSRVINDTSRIQWFITNAPISVIGQPVKLIALFGIAFWINIKLTFVLAIFLPLSYAAIKITSRAIKISSKKIIELYEKIFSFLEQKLYGIEAIKSFTTELKEVSSFSELNNEAFRTELTRYRSIAAIAPLQQLLMGACIIFILWIGAHEVSAEKLSPGSFAAFGAISFSIYALVSKIGRTYNRIQISKQSCDRVFAILDLPPEDSGRLPCPGDIENIHISNLSFSYSPDLAVLEKISLDIKKNETILVKGPSGCGKTTLFRIIMGFYKPTAGDVTINSIPISEYDTSSLRNKINMVSQEPILFNDNILNNIVYGSSSPEESSIKAALSLSCLDFIEELENGIYTQVGDRGVKLSAGQKQRVALARAILRGGTVLLLDEATSGIDEETEKKILSNLIASKVFHTILIVSHRSSIEQFADRIFTISPKSTPGTIASRN